MGHRRGPGGAGTRIDGRGLGGGLLGLVRLGLLLRLRLLVRSGRSGQVGRGPGRLLGDLRRERGTLRGQVRGLRRETVTGLGLRLRWETVAGLLLGLRLGRGQLR